MKIVTLTLFIIFSLPSFGSDNTKLTFMTYNLGLAHTFVPYAKERRASLIHQLQNVDSDILCLQEIWTQEDREKVMDSLKDKYPHILMPPITQSTVPEAPACRIRDLFGEGKIVSCFKDTCEGLKGDEFTQCVIIKCKDSLIKLKKNRIGCAQALMAQVGKNPLLTILKLLWPFGRPGVFVYEGSEGTMLLSKHPFVKGSTGFKDLSKVSTLTHRGIIYADLSFDSKNFFMACTHLTANLSKAAPYAGSFSGWEEENRNQVSQLIELANIKGKSKIKVLMGDMNAGPSIKSANINGDFEKSYNNFLKAGYIPSFVNNPNVQCTTCNTNNLREINDNNNIIDHVLFKDLPTESNITSKVFFTEKTKIEINGVPIETNLSDHFGIQASYSW